MQINLSELFTLEGKEKTWKVPFEARTFHNGGNIYPAVSEAPVTIVLKNLGNRKLALTGEADISLTIPCDRCLTPVDVPVHLDFDLELDMKAADEDRVKDLDEQPFLSGYNLDVDILVLNELSLNLPMKVLCKEDCKGICNRCGANLNFETCDCDTGSLDPRMAVIQDIFKQFKEV